MREIFLQLLRIAGPGYDSLVEVVQPRGDLQHGAPGPARLEIRFLGNHRLNAAAAVLQDESTGSDFEPKAFIDLVWVFIFAFFYLW